MNDDLVLELYGYTRAWLEAGIIDGDYLRMQHAQYERWDAGPGIERFGRA